MKAQHDDETQTAYERRRKTFCQPTAQEAWEAKTCGVTSRLRREGLLLLLVLMVLTGLWSLLQRWRGRLASCRLVVLSACRTQVGPERTRVRSSTVKRERACEARGKVIREVSKHVLLEGDGLLVL